MFYEPDIAVIGGGPAGLMAAVTAAEAGASILLIERDGHLGGQLVKQTHKFFGSEKQHASVRGIDIAGLLSRKLAGFSDLASVWTDATAIGLYEDGVLTVEHRGRYKKVRPERIIAATGASEKYLSFPNNDLPGIYGAGAVQTMMNVHGVRPGKRVLMIGAGNIGLIVSYQLLQAGVEVAAIVEGLPAIGGYLVHASKIRRAGVPILTSHTIVRADGKIRLNRLLLPGSTVSGISSPARKRLLPAMSSASRPASPPWPNFSGRPAVPCAMSRSWAAMSRFATTGLRQACPAFTSRVT